MGRPKKQAAQKQAEKLAEQSIILPKPSGIVVGSDNSAMIPPVIIPPDLKAEGYDLNHGFIDSTGNTALKGVVFYIKIVEERDTRHGKTVHAKSLTHYWNGSAKDFKNSFERA